MLPPAKQLAIKRDILLGVPLFRKLTAAEIEAVAARAVTQHYARGTTILRKGDPATTTIVIVQGRVRIGLLTDEGREASWRVLGPGEVLGEIALLDGQDRSADATALEECVLLSVDNAHFLTLLRGSSDLCLRLMKTLCERIRRTTQSLEEAVLLDLPTRLGRQLQRMAEDYGVSTPQGTKINVRLSQSELAGLVGASREKVNRQLRQWEHEGVIANEHGYLVMLRPERLGAPAS
jgi:CRP/FNR family cyclic AMP-dependent transcriptional regulator